MSLWSTAFFGAHLVPQRAEYERDRALQRGIVCIVLCAMIAIDIARRPGTVGDPRLLLLAAGLMYAAAGFIYRSYVAANPTGGVLLQYAFLVGDPAFLVLALVLDAEQLAFAYPFVFLEIIRCGLRYGNRTMWLAWTATLVATLLLVPLSGYWLRETELALSYLLLLALVPVCFLSLIQRIHDVRAVEEERARIGAMRDVVTARSAFLAKVSHELRSPLQGIVSALDVFQMRHSQGAVEDDELIGRMRRSSMLLNTQLRDLLTLARGEAGRLEMHPQPFEVTALVDAVVLAVRDSAREKGLELKTERPTGSIFVVADGARIDQILTNLVVNSIRYTQAGEIRLTLSPYDRDSKCLRLSVADTGPGIPADRIPGLLEPDKLTASNYRRGEGSGIGLAVVRTLMDHLGGTVTVTSLENVGTKFELSIPAELIDPEASATTSEANTGRILIVDDREDVLIGLTSVIHQLGYDCDRASTAATAGNLLAMRRYDAVLLDIQMPFKSGVQLARETRRGTGPNRETRLLGMSAAATTAQYVDGPFDACLTKPIDRNALISALREEWLETWPSSTV